MPETPTRGGANLYVGIDLGTSNSAICTYNGARVDVHLSPEQHRVTPSAIYLDKRGRYHGARAYQMLAHHPDRVALRFKRMMGTNTAIDLASADAKLTPEECSAEILRVLFGYLPEDLRAAGRLGTVITVPAAFNQMQKDATLEAARLADIGAVALMQEPVAAVMAAMRSATRDGGAASGHLDGFFLVYDLGGGTFDVALAESAGGSVSILSHGGIPMCGGADLDRRIVENLVFPWLVENFQLPSGFSSLPAYRRLLLQATAATEKAKIELSSREAVTISCFDGEIRLQDLDGQDIYLDVPLTRADVEPLLWPLVTETVNATRATLEEAGLEPTDITRIVFVGGPTQYEPLRRHVCGALGIEGDARVDPMTAVAEGAAIFAESVDWSKASRVRKSASDTAGGGVLDIRLDYLSRTAATSSRVRVHLPQPAQPGSSLQIDSVDIGWSSGRVDLLHGAEIELPLQRAGSNQFRAFVFGPDGAPIKLASDLLTVARTAMTVAAIPASHSIGLQVRDRVGGSGYRLDRLVAKGDQLPAAGKRTFRVEEPIKAGSAGKFVLRLWEGEVEDPIDDNTPVGECAVSGADFEFGTIQRDADVVVEYQVADSGKISFSVTVPSVGISFTRSDFYARQAGQIDFANQRALIQDAAQDARKRVDELAGSVDDERLGSLRDQLNDAEKASTDGDSEDAKRAHETVLQAKRTLAEVRRTNLGPVRKAELDEAVESFASLREMARPSEIAEFDSAARAARRDVLDRTGRFEQSLDAMQTIRFQVLSRQDWFQVETHRYYAARPHLFADPTVFRQLVADGEAALEEGDIDRLREVVRGYRSNRHTLTANDVSDLEVNLVRA